MAVWLFDPVLSTFCKQQQVSRQMPFSTFKDDCIRYLEVSQVQRHRDTVAERSFDQPVQIVQTGPVQEASGANLDGCQRGEEAVMPAGDSKVGVLVLLALASIFKAGLMWNGQLNQVNIGAIPHDNIRSLICQSHRRREVIAGAREISDDVHALNQDSGQTRKRRWTQGHCHVSCCTSSAPRLQGSCSGHAGGSGPGHVGGMMMIASFATSTGSGCGVACPWWH